MAELWELDNNSAPQKVLLYGDSKTGKTLLAGQLAEKFQLHWFDFENGYKTLLQLPKETQRNISLYRVRDSYTQPTAIETAGKISDHLDSFNPQDLSICPDHGKIGCPICRKADKEAKVFNVSNLTNQHIVVWDSLTQLSQSAFKLAMKKGDKNPALGEKAEFDQWGLQGAMLERVLNAVQNAPCHFVVISHETAIEDNEGKEKLYAVSGTRNFTRTSGKYFDHVVRSYLKNKKHSAASSTTSFSHAVSGSRLNVDVSSSLIPFFDAENYIAHTEEQEAEEKKEGNSAGKLSSARSFRSKSLGR